MSPDKNKPARNSTSGGDQECSKPPRMDYSSGPSLPTTSDVTTPSHGTVNNIPSLTASQPTLKCSINNQMKTFDPGEESGIERLTYNHSGNSIPSGKNNSNSLIKNSTKNYKAGSKINKLADMLAKRSQNVVEVKQNSSSDIITDIASVPKTEEDSVILNNVSNVTEFEKSLNSPVTCFEKTMDDSELRLFRKSRRKSVPNQSCSLQVQSQSTSKSCSDISRMFPSKENGKPEFNALGGDSIKLQTDESTKKKPIRKNLKNVELPLILPERKRRSSLRSDNLISSKVVEKLLEIPSEAVALPAEINKNKESPNEIVTSSLQSPNCSFSSTKLKKDRKVKQRKSKRLVENSTQTADIEFLSVLKPKPEGPVTDIVDSCTYECLYCTEMFTTVSLCKAHEKTHSQKSSRELIKCQYCAKKLNSLGELKSHCFQKHPNKYSYCMKCDERFVTKDKLYSHNREVHLNKIKDVGSRIVVIEEIVEKSSDEAKEQVEDKPNDKKVNKQNGTKEDAEDKSNDKRVNKQGGVKENTDDKPNDKKVNKQNGTKEDEDKPNDRRVSKQSSAKENADDKVIDRRTNKQSGAKEDVEDKSNDKKMNKQSNAKEDVDDKPSDRKVTKPNGSKTDLKVDVSYDNTKKSSVSPRNVQKISPKETRTEEQLLEMEMLFYSHLTGNIQENLTNHLDGKIDQSGNPVRTDQVIESTESSLTKTKNSNLLSVASPSAGVPDVQLSRAPSPYQTRSKTPNPLPPTAKKFKKLPNWQQKFWEKYNFPTNYRLEHRFWDKNYLNTDKSAFYLKDLSCLDIKTQLTMRENIKKLDSIKKMEESSKPVNKLKFPDYLSLVPNNGNSEENSGESQRNKKQIRKEETKKSFKSPGSELPVVKNRRKISSDNTTAPKRQSERSAGEGLKMMTRRQSSLELLKDDKEESSRRRKGSLDLSEGQRMILRRQTSLDNLGTSTAVSMAEKTNAMLELNLNKVESDSTPLSPTESAEISGEWVRPRSYLCGTCCTKFTNLWELEDHKWVSHPNVWCTHYEFEDDKIDKLFQKNEDEGTEGDSSQSSTVLSKSKLTDLYKRYLLPHGSLKTAKLVPKTNFPEQCTKCKKNCMNSSEMHKHMLDCGGDTTWFLTMYSSPMTIKRKWRPFGSRRRKQIGRKDVKRNIPSTPNLRPYHYQQHRIRTKPGDVESIQKMLANLPEKRARRAINFDEIKTRSQATIHSNRLLRKRFKSSFSNNFLKFKNMKQKRQLKQGRKESSSKSTTDTSSENTPTGSPKRRNKLKESLQLPKEDNSRDGSSETSEDPELKSSKKKSQNKKKESGQQEVKAAKSKGKKGKTETTKDKPMTRSNGPTSSNGNSRSKRKTPLVKEEVFVEVEVNDGTQLEQTKTGGKTSKKRSHNKTTETAIKEEVSEVSDLSLEIIEAKETPSKIARKMKTKDSVEAEGSNQKIFQWANTQSNPILRLNQRSKEKTELLKRINKKVKNSKRILELKEAKKVESGSRRSLRIKSLQHGEDDSEVFNGQIPEEPKTSFGSFGVSQKDSKVKASVINLEKKPPRLPPSVKNSRSSDQKSEKELSEKEGSVVIERRSSRTLRNSISFEEKPETVSNEEIPIVIPNSRSILRRNSKNVYEMTEPPLPDVVIEDVIISKKSLRIQNDRGFRIGREKSEPVVAKGQISLLKKNRLPTKPLIEENKPEECLPDQNRTNDLAEMPILAKVEPIRSKISRKMEKEIPILMPVEKELNENSSQEMAPGDDSINFQVIKKRRKTSKEVTPLKIVKKVDGVVLEVGSSSRIDGEDNDSPEEDSFEIEKSKRKKKLSADGPATESIGKTVKTDVKKYFLGICPSEIDKGRREGQDESGSDSEPLISLITNQSQKENKSDDLIEKKNEVFEIEKDEEESGEPSVEHVKKIKMKKKRKTEVKKTSSGPSLPNLIITRTEGKEKVDNVTLNTEAVQSAERESREELSLAKESVETSKIKKQTPKKKAKGLRMTVTLKEPTLKIIDKPVSFTVENKWMSKPPEPKTQTEPVREPQTPLEESVVSETFLPERRSRRISKETKSSTEFIIDDPLLLVDELWSDLDSDSDSTKKKTKKGKKKSPKKKTAEEKRVCDVNLEELLRNFGENKERPSNPIKVVRKRSGNVRSTADVRKALENRKVQQSYRRLSLKLFRFNKTHTNFGNRGYKLSEAKKALKQKLDQSKSTSLPDLPFLVAEIKENPVQVIQCGAQKSKPLKKGHRKSDPKLCDGDIQLKISLPLESIDNMGILNNNHLTELVVEEPKTSLAVSREEPPDDAIKKEVVAQVEPPQEIVIQDVSPPVEPADGNETKNKTKRLEVIDKIFYCEICKTYYYSSSQLKIHKLSNRHKLKEAELMQAKKEPVREPNIENQIPVEEPVPAVESVAQETSVVEIIEPEKLNEDTLEMPTLEGPFIENPSSRVGPEPSQPPQPQPPVVSSFGFSQESLKDIQRAIGCTDEEMLILTLLGENTIEIENDILDLDSCRSGQSKPSQKTESSVKESEKANGALKVDLKQRMTSALACLVNKAVFNLLQKYETAAKSAVNPEALSLLGKLSTLSRRKNILQLNELLKKENDGESSLGGFSKDLDKKETTVSYKYQCTICGSRFEKASTRECHISRSHKGKALKSLEEAQAQQTPPEDDWNDSWSYDMVDDHPGSTTTSQFWCSDCGINFQSPQEVLEHQKLEHQAGAKDAEQGRDSGPLQSSTIGSSDEIMEGKKTRRRPKLFSSEELDQQRIIANNELRKLDRKFSNKNKSGKIKWGMDALRFTVEKENKMVVVEEEKEVLPEEPAAKTSIDLKNIDLVPKLNLSRTSNIPEFKVIQKNSLKNRFQKIIDNKLKRRSTCSSQQETEGDEVETEVMLVPVVVKKKNKKQKMSKYSSKKEESDKPVDVYDFNESESEGEPVVYSHIKKPTPSPTKLRLVKVKEGPSKNKADSTTKDLAPDDYDSEDSLPLSVVKKSKPGEEDDEKEEKMSEDGAEKSEGILEQVEYLIEQLENETGSSNKENDSKEDDVGNELKKGKDLEYSKDPKEESVDFVLTTEDSVKVSVANEFLELDDLPLKIHKNDKNEDTIQGNGGGKTSEQIGGVLAEPESSQSTFDEEDSIPLMLMSKKAEETRSNQGEEKKSDENITDVSTTASEDVQLFRPEETKNRDAHNSSINSQTVIEESLPPVFSSSENEGGFSDKSNKPFESLNGNVIYCRNDSMSDFCTDLSNDDVIDSNFEKTDSQETDKSFIKEVTEKEDVVIVCSKGIEEESDESKDDGNRLKFAQRKKKSNVDAIRKKKKRFPLLTATIEENNFRKSESPKLNKEVIVRKIWNRRKLTEDSSDNDEDSYTSFDNENSLENIQNDESQTEIEKEIIVKKIWSRKKVDHEEELAEKVEEGFDDMKINQTEVSDEVVIKCGPKAKSSPKRRKSRSSTNESSKETIMRKIWSGRCTFQTKAALKTYDSDVMPNCNENETEERQEKPKRRGRPSGFSVSKRSKTESDANRDDEDDLDSLLEEIEREQLEKAIRSEFLQLRRSEKANVEMKEGSNPTVGLFAETSLKPKKEMSEKKRRKVRKKIKHPRQSLLNRKKYLKRPVRRVLPTEERIFSESTNRGNLEPGATEQSETSLDKNNEAFGAESKLRIRKHKKHRHKHHHHKHKHKKSKHHKCIVGKHKSKHKLQSGGEDENTENADSFTILEKICSDIPNQIENESNQEFESETGKGETDSDGNSQDSKAEDTLSSFPFESNKKPDPEEKLHRESKNVYEFVEDVPDFTGNGLKNLKM